MNNQRSDSYIPPKQPTVNDLLTLLDDLEYIQSSYDGCAGSAQAGGIEELRRIDSERHECRNKLIALFMAAQEATYPPSPESGDEYQRGWDEAIEAAAKVCLNIRDQAVMSKFVTQTDCGSFRSGAWGCMQSVSALHSGSSATERPA